MRNTIIKDPALEPFFLSKDQYCYTIMEMITPDEKNIGKFGKKNNGNQGKDYEKALSYHSDLASALKKITSLKLHGQSEYATISSYIQEFENQKEQINKLVSKLEVI